MKKQHGLGMAMMALAAASVPLPGAAAEELMAAALGSSAIKRVVEHEEVRAARLKELNDALDARIAEERANSPAVAAAEAKRARKAAKLQRDANRSAK